MATEKVNKADMEVASPQSERVEIRVPRGRPNEDPNVFVSVNGVNYLIPKGQTSVVPRFVADEYYRSLKATDDYYDAMERRAEEARESSRQAMGI